MLPLAPPYLASMATLTRDGSGESVTLRSRHLIGRVSTCALTLSHPSVSGEHALVSWSAGSWHVRDLGSRNGTHLDGAPIPAGQTVEMASGSRLGFGKDSEPWVLTDATAPWPAAVDLSTGEAVTREPHVLQLPGPDQPLVTIHRGPGGDWVAETSDSVAPVRTHDRIEAGGRWWELFLADGLDGTVGFDDISTIDSITLRFQVSMDEEHVAIDAVDGKRVMDLGSRSSHYMLLLLARTRREEQATDELPESAAGWVYRDELATMLGIDVLRLNVLIHRARRQLEATGVLEAARLIEVRPGTRQIRLGVRDTIELRV